MFPFYLPLESAGQNPCHEIRDDALCTFDRLGIVWHGAALLGLPLNHLCSSQIFCANAIYPFINRPEGITSIDAMVMYEATDGLRVMLLIEWKYSESYGATNKRFRSDSTDRIEPYRAFFYDKLTPIDLTVASQIEDFMLEPFYQLLRQQLLVARIVDVGIPDVDRIRLVHVHTTGNRVLKAITSPGFRDLGRDAYEVWQHLLVEPSDFIAITTENFPLACTLRSLSRA